VAFLYLDAPSVDKGPLFVPLASDVTEQLRTLENAREDGVFNLA
jgi:hypothetical protein